MTFHPPFDCRHFQDSRSTSLGTFPQQIRPSLDPEYTLSSAKIGDIRGQNGVGPGARVIHSFQRPVRRPDNGEGVLFNGRRLLFPHHSSITPLKPSLDRIPFPSTPIASHEHCQVLKIQFSAIVFPCALPNRVIFLVHSTSSD